MAQSDARFGYKAKLGRTDHNLSQPLGFTCAPGMLLPIWFDFATPGDSYYMQHDLPLLRSIQLVAPSMVDVKVHYETFFVPIQMIYQPAENTLFSLNNIQSSVYTRTNLQNMNFPLLAYGSFTNYIKTTFPNSEIRQEAFRLADLFGLCQMNFIDTSAYSSGVLSDYGANFFPWQLCAYQIIFQNYYRLDDKTQFNQYGNIDNQYDQATFGGTAIQYWHIYQRPWDFDYYTSMYRSPIVSDQNLQGVLPFSPYNPLTDLSQARRKANGNETVVNSETTGFGPTYTSAVSAQNNYNTITTTMIRQLFANEKLAMITGRTKKNYDSQVLAHYGVNVPHDVKHDITMIHHDIYDLQVQEVTSLASTSDAPLGELAGKSYAAGNGKQFKFTAPCHGVMMTIFSIEPKKRYITGFDRINSVTNAMDFPVPEFDRMGNVPMFRYESNWQKGASFSNGDIIGWKERYYQNKRKMPKVTFAFYGANGINNFGAYFLTSCPFAHSSISSGNWYAPVRTFPRPDLEENFYIERGCLDMMCVAPYVNSFLTKNPETGEGEDWNDKPWLLYARDPFIVNSHVKCKKVSWMSKDGEPIYD